MPSVSGVTSARSIGAALLLAASPTTGIFETDGLIETILNHVVGGRVSTARRIAAELSRFGRSDLVDYLPLSETERTWWKAICHLRFSDFNGATTCLVRLPIDRYPDATGLLARCMKAADAPRRQLAEQRLRERLRTTGEVVCGAATAAGVDAAPLQWLDDPTATVPSATSPNVDSAAVELLRVVLRGNPSAPQLKVPSGVSLSVLDDAIAAGGRLDPASLAAMPADDARYLRARLNPEQLTDDEVAELEFDSERLRRGLATGAHQTTPPQPAASGEVHYLVGLTSMARGEPSTAVVRARHPETAGAFDAFIASPQEGNLTAGLAADPSLWPVMSNRLDSDALGWNPERNSEARRFVAWHALRTAAAHLMEARWQSAAQAAKHALRLSDGEAMRDEALNLMACAHWQLGNDDAAQQALTTALEGSRNPSLQVNLGVVAGGLDPEAAALELARLVREADSIDLRTSAALKAVGLWLTDDVPWVSEQEHGMPEPLALALRSVVVEPITLDAFRQIVKLQSTFDDDWLAIPSSLAGSPHKSSVEARVFQARASGPDELVDALTDILRTGSAPAWVVDERDALLSMIVRHALEDDTSGAGFFAFAAMEKGLPIEPEQRDMLIPLSVHGVCGMLHSKDEAAAPHDKFTKLLADGERDARSRGTYSRFDDLYTSAWNRLAAAHGLYYQAFLLEAAEAFDRLVGQIGHVPKRRLNMTVVRQAFGPIRDGCREAAKTMNDFLSHIQDDDIREFVNGLLSNLRLLAGEAEKMMR